MTKKTKKEKTLFFVTIFVSVMFVFLLSFSFVMAFSYVPLSPLPGTTAVVDNKNTVSGLGTYITGIYKIVIGLAIILSVIMFILAGLEWMTAEAVGKKADAIKRINATLFGLALTLGSWLFLNTISPNLVNFNLNIKDVNLVDDSRPDLFGWYCKTEKEKNSGAYLYIGPYSSAQKCAETGCENCLHVGSDGDGGSGGNGTEVSGSNLIKYYDTTAPIYKNCPSYEGTRETDLTQKCDVIYQEGPGWYYNYRDGAAHYKKGPRDTETMCEADRLSETKTVVSYCYKVELGNNDSLLNKILGVENSIRDALKSPASGGIVNISTSSGAEKKCEFVGETGCTNVGGLDVGVISYLKSLKTSCDAWAGTGKNCEITITGGTEWWPHGNKNLDAEKNTTTKHKPTFFSSGFGKTVDLRLNGLLDSFIKEKKTSGPIETTLGDKYILNTPTITGAPGSYLLEKDLSGTVTHWHIEFY